MERKHNFRELKIWRNSMDLVKILYRLIENISPDEKFGLKSQISKCAVCLPSNIAEGSARSTSKDFMRFPDISVGSAYELETQLILVSEIFSLPVGPEIENARKFRK
jgi:four helix bundle protein